MNKSPFLIKQDFIPIKLCEQLLDSAYIEDAEFFSEEIDSGDVNFYIQQIAKELSSHYDVKIKQSKMFYEVYNTDYVEAPRADNSVYSNGSWYRNKDIDFTTIIFLKDGNLKAPIDINLEVFGGKLEFPTFNFGINPEMGTCVTFPAYPNFLNVFTPAKIGTNHILRISHESDIMFSYDHSKFPGELKSWFKNLN